MLFSLVLAASALKDLHKTSVKLIPDGKHFHIAIQRVDTLVKDHPVAVKVSQYSFTFDVTPKGVVVNNQVVPLGVSNAELKTTVMEVGPKKDLDKFDVGIVAVRLAVQGREIQKDGVTVKVITIAEEILQINGKELDDLIAIEQVLVVSPSGAVSHEKPKLIAHIPKSANGHSFIQRPQQVIQPSEPSFINKHEQSVVVEPCNMRRNHPNWKHFAFGALFFLGLALVLSRVALAIYSLFFYLISPSARYVPVVDQEKTTLPEKS